MLKTQWENQDNFRWRGHVTNGVHTVGYVWEQWPGYEMSLLRWRQVAQAVRSLREAVGASPFTEHARFRSVRVWTAGNEKLTLKYIKHHDKWLSRRKLRDDIPGELAACLDHIPFAWDFPMKDDPTKQRDEALTLAMANSSVLAHMAGPLVGNYLDKYQQYYRYLVPYLPADAPLAAKMLIDLYQGLRMYDREYLLKAAPKERYEALPAAIAARLPEDGQELVLVTRVIGDGRGIVPAVQELRECGYTVNKVCAMLDMEYGAEPYLRTAKVDLISLLGVSELPPPPAVVTEKQDAERLDTGGCG